jgi:peptidoglycan/LPS O-acetylase OafA/YrhL
VPEHIYFTVIFVLLAWGLSQKPVTLLVNRVTTTAGVMSFSIYILHFAAIDIARKIFGFPLRGYNPGQIDNWLDIPLLAAADLSPSVRFAMIFAVTILITFPTAAITYRLIEQPGIAAGRRLIRYLGW